MTTNQGARGPSGQANLERVGVVSMRIPVPDIERIKAAAKKLAALAANTTLSAVQAHLACSLGYKDWHSLRVEGPAAQLPQPDLPRLASLVVDLAVRLDVPLGDVQYTLATSRMISPMTLSQQLELRAAVWRRHVGPPARGKPGSLVRDQSDPDGKLAYLCQAGRPTYLLFDTGPGARGEFEVVYPRIPASDFVPSRLWLPYGCWSTRDGAEVFFSRDYLPLWRVTAHGVERMEPWLWIEGITNERHYGPLDWSGGAAHKAAIAELDQRRVTGIPMLVDAMQILIQTSAPSVQDAVGLLAQERASVAAIRPGTSINGWLSF